MVNIVERLTYMVKYEPRLGSCPFQFFFFRFPQSSFLPIFRKIVSRRRHSLQKNIRLFIGREHYLRSTRSNARYGGHVRVQYVICFQSNN